jgi:hypothetical protein
MRVPSKLVISETEITRRKIRHMFIGCTSPLMHGKVVERAITDWSFCCLGDGIQLFDMVMVPLNSLRKDQNVCTHMEANVEWPCAEWRRKERFEGANLELCGFYAYAD